MASALALARRIAENQKAPRPPMEGPVGERADERSAQADERSAQADERSAQADERSAQAEEEPIEVPEEEMPAARLFLLTVPQRDGKIVVDASCGLDVAFVTPGESSIDQRWLHRYALNMLEVARNNPDIQPSNDAMLDVLRKRFSTCMALFVKGAGGVTIRSGDFDKPASIYARLIATYLESITRVKMTVNGCHVPKIFSVAGDDIDGIISLKQTMDFGMKFEFPEIVPARLSQEEGVGLEQSLNTAVETTRSVQAALGALGDIQGFTYKLNGLVTSGQLVYYADWMGKLKLPLSEPYAMLMRKVDETMAELRIRCGRDVYLDVGALGQVDKLVDNNFGLNRFLSGIAQHVDARIASRNLVGDNKFITTFAVINDLESATVDGHNWKPVALDANGRRAPGDSLPVFKMDGSATLMVDYEQCRDPSIPTGLPRGIRGAETYEMTRVFDNTFSAANVAAYMGLNASIRNGLNTFVFTVGYSGVGKTNLLFGGGDRVGIMHSVFNNLPGFDSVTLSIFEIHGMRLGIETEEAIYEYKFADTNSATLQAGTLVVERLDRWSKVLGANFAPAKLKQIGLLNTMTAIDNERFKNRRVCETPNNPESSRSIMIFRLVYNRQDGGKPVTFILADLPGKERVGETFVVGVGNNNNVYAGRDVETADAGLRLMLNADAVYPTPLTSLSVAPQNLRPVQRVMNIHQNPQTTSLSVSVCDYPGGHFESGGAFVTIDGIATGLNDMVNYIFGSDKPFDYVLARGRKMKTLPKNFSDVADSGTAHWRSVYQVGKTVRFTNLAAYVGGGDLTGSSAIINSLEVRVSNGFQIVKVKPSGKPYVMFGHETTNSDLTDWAVELNAYDNVNANKSKKIPRAWIGGDKITPTAREWRGLPFYIVPTDDNGGKPRSMGPEAGVRAAMAGVGGALREGTNIANKLDTIHRLLKPQILYVPADKTGDVRDAYMNAAEGLYINANLAALIASVSRAPGSAETSVDPWGAPPPALVQMLNDGGTNITNYLGFFVVSNYQGMAKKMREERGRGMAHFQAYRCNTQGRMFMEMHGDLRTLILMSKSPREQ